MAKGITEELKETNINSKTRKFENKGELIEN